ncbi:MAG: response regulator, partial [Nitrospiraceae bacterium]
MSSQADSDCAHLIQADAVTHQPKEGRSSCLFVVGQAVFQRKKIWKSLEESGNLVCRFTDQAAALASIGPTSPDAILCEVTMPIEPVFELLNRLAGVESDVCVILIGPDLGAEQVARSLRGGAFDYLTAPVPAPRIWDSLQRGLLNRQAFQSVRNLSGQLAQVNTALAGERDVLRQWNVKLSQLNHLTQVLAGSLNSEFIARSLFEALADLVPVDVIGLGQPDPQHVWTWSRTTACEGQEQRVRAHLLSRF